MVHLETHTEPAQPLDPAAQQRRRFERARVNAATGRLEGFHPELGRPCAQGGWIKVGDQALPDFRGLVGAGVAADKTLERLAVSEVQPTLARDEKLPPDRRLAVV